MDSPSAYQKGGEHDNVEAKVFPDIYSLFFFFFLLKSANSSSQAMSKAAEQVEKVVRERAGVMNTVRNVRLRSVVTRAAAQRVFMPVWMVKYVYPFQMAGFHSL